MGGGDLQGSRTLCLMIIQGSTRFSRSPYSLSDTLCLKLYKGTYQVPLPSGKLIFIKKTYFRIVTSLYWVIFKA